MRTGKQKGNLFLKLNTKNQRKEYILCSRRNTKEPKISKTMYSQDYEVALVATNVEQWPRLKKKLSSPEADQVVKALRDYLEAKNHVQTCLTIYQDNVIKPLDDYLDAKDQGQDITRPVYQHSRDERSKMMSNWLASFDIQDKTRDELLLLLR